MNNLTLAIQPRETAAFLSEAERKRIVYGWNDTHVAIPELCVHELFEQQVARAPHAIAIIFRDVETSYSQLNARANQIARHLHKIGVGPETLVGICLERSPEMVMALLGVWKAGGAYVPLDPHYPPDRLSFMVNDAGLKVVLINENTRNSFSATNASLISLEADWTSIGKEDTSNPTSGTVPSNLAYVMYTSGSTGQPKGAMIQHNGLVNYLCWTLMTYVQPAGPVPIHSSIAFDSTVASLYPPLLCGGQIELLPEDIGVRSLLAALSREKNRSRVVITPSHLQMLSRELEPSDMPNITKILIVAGETLLAERLSEWRKFASHTRIFNEYGPTETVVGCCNYELHAEDPQSGPVPIGRPIANTQLYILDPEMRPLPIGTIGELYVGGIGVARGYLNRPELTRDKFLANPFSDQSGARLYKTGDLVRYRADGNIEFVGRTDEQVKVRGYRIELGEIEAVLASYHGLRACKVLVHEDSSGNNQLIAYVAEQEESLIQPGSLRAFAKRRLPEHMVPAKFIILDFLPLTPNGKIDCEALKQQACKQSGSMETFVAPTTETEEKLAAIWMRLLKLERVGILDDFFELGGNSLLAIRAMSEIRDAFGSALSFHAFFPSCTIASLTEALVGCAKCPDRSAYAVPVQPEGDKPIFFCVESGNLLRPLSIQLGADQPFLSIGLEPSAAQQFQAPYRTEELARHLVLAIREKQPQGPYYLGGFCQGAVFAFEIAKQLMTQGHVVGLLVLFEPKYPSQTLAARMLLTSKRMNIRLRSHLDELKRAGTSGLLSYGRRRSQDVKRWLTHLRWHISYHCPRVNRSSTPESLDKIIFLAASSYHAEPLACPTAIFQCKDWPIISAGDPYAGWRDFLTGRCETYEVPGNHTGIFSEPNVKYLAGQLRSCLRKAQKLGQPSL